MQKENNEEHTNSSFQSNSRENIRTKKDIKQGPGLAAKLVPAFAIVLAVISLANILISDHILKEEIRDQIATEDQKLIKAYSMLFADEYADSLDQGLRQDEAEASLETITGRVEGTGQFEYFSFTISRDNSEGTRSSGTCEFKTDPQFGEILSILEPVTLNDGTIIGFIDSGISVDQDRISEEVGHASLKQIIFMSLFGILGLVLLTIYVLITIVNPTKRSANALNKIIEDIRDNHGNLDEKIPAGKNDEIAVLSRGINDFISTLSDVISKIRETSLKATNVNKVITEEIAESNDNANMISASTEELFASMEVMSESCEEINGSVEEVNANMDNIIGETEKGNLFVEEMRDRAGNIRDFCEEKQKNIQQALADRKTELETSVASAGRVEEISSLTEAIMALTRRTTLLALNASIEAARAGESGKGFAVVANEISDLAKKSQETVSTIQVISTEVITAVENLMQNAMALVEEMGETITEDYSRFREMGGSYYNDAGEIERIFSNFYTNATQTDGAISEIAQSIEGIVVSVSECTEGTKSIVESVQILVESISNIHESNEGNRENFDELTNEIERFQ